MVSAAGERMTARFAERAAVVLFSGLTERVIDPFGGKGPMPNLQSGSTRNSRDPDRKPEVIKAAFLAAGSFGATVVSILGFGVGTDDGLRFAIGTVGAIFAAAMLIAAIYVVRR